MTEAHESFRYPFQDAHAEVFIANISKRFGRDVGTVWVKDTRTGHYLVDPQDIELFNKQHWAKLAAVAAAIDNSDENVWAGRFMLVRIGLHEDLSSATAVTPQAPSDNGTTLDQDSEILMPTEAFPESAWRDQVEEYRRAIGPTTEAPDAYHYFTFMLGLGATLGRRLFVYHAVSLFPNFFVSLVGKSGVSRKDTARSRINKLLNELHFHQNEDSPTFILQDGIGSAEGLLECFAGSGKVVVAQEGELLSLMSKARRDATSNLIPILTNLFDCPDYKTLRTRNRPIIARNTFCCLLAPTTPVWLKRALTEEHALGGFANRFTFVYGVPKPAIDNPPKVDPDLWSTLLHNINEIRLWAGDGEREIPKSGDAETLFSDWYGGYYKLASGEGLLPALSVRFQSFAWKLALLYAAMEYSDTIEGHHLEAGLAVVDWLWHSNAAAFADFSDHGRGLEDNIIQRIRAVGGTIDKRSLYKSMKISAAELAKHTTPMCNLGILQNISWPGQNGRQIEGFSLLI